MDLRRGCTAGSLDCVTKEDSRSERDEALAANRALDARIRATAEATSFGPSEGWAVEADEQGRVVWRFISGNGPVSADVGGEPAEPR